MIGVTRGGLGPRGGSRHGHGAFGGMARGLRGLRVRARRVGPALPRLPPRWALLLLLLLLSLLGRGLLRLMVRVAAGRWIPRPAWRLIAVRRGDLEKGKRHVFTFRTTGIAYFEFESLEMPTN